MIFITSSAIHPITHYKFLKEFEISWAQNLIQNHSVSSRIDLQKLRHFKNIITCLISEFEFDVHFIKH